VALAHHDHDYDHDLGTQIRPEDLLPLGPESLHGRIESRSNTRSSEHLPEQCDASTKRSAMRMTSPACLSSKEAHSELVDGEDLEVTQEGQTPVRIAEAMEGVSSRIHELKFPPNARADAPNYDPEKEPIADAPYLCEMDSRQHCTGMTEAVRILTKTVRSYAGESMTTKSTNGILRGKGKGSPIGPAHPAAMHKRGTCRMHRSREFCTILDHVKGDSMAGLAASLMHCLEVTYDGGKGAKQEDFRRTADQKYVIKRLKSVEGLAFVSNCELYTKHVLQNLTMNVQSLIVKIFAFFQIDVAGETSYYIVQENLFPDSIQVMCSFDLKGMRGRSQKPGLATGWEKELFKLGDDEKLLVSSSSKEKFDAAIASDMQMLERMNVIDYSLLVGISASGNLVVGIVDYLREYTMVMRVYGTVWSNTICKPSIYRQRFEGYMAKEFVRGVRIPHTN